MSWQWKTYTPSGAGALWMTGLDGHSRGVLTREVHRLQRLLLQGHWYGPDKRPLTDEERADIQHDLMLWASPVDVLQLMRGDGGHFGPSTRRRTIAHLEQLLEPQR